ncbi:MAG: UDP-N-acetylmuramoyl-tripeptide--D-alanyl-D-alanine ligase [Chloroflexi bacterium]|nr:MAG: UDP-N-acetylmuramoyl-tripeptide--D-alanyl-D-alanine ligase [Chloroflexota bacterium]TME46839.1 MAG: UDP-N-acetylmuramoyl-tripeptide--D-alanyl-D-alanine ligase [Chloroflexota bacterium]
MSLTEVLQATHGRLVSGPHEAAFVRLVIDSREVTAGGLFVALKGEQQDGHAYIGQAVDRGATGILCERPPLDVQGPAVVEVADTRQALADLTADRLRRQPVPIVAITGSAGKTTTKELIAHVLGRRLRVHKSEGNLNTYTGIPMTVFQMDPRDRALVVEYAMSRAGEIRELTRAAPPNIGVVLNVGLAHVGFLGSIEGVAAAKRELVEGLAAGGLAVLNADDPRVRAMASAARRVTFYGLAQGAQVRADKVRLHGLEGSTFMLHSPRGRSEVFLRIPGQHSISNALAAAAVAIEFGFDAAAVASALHGFLPPSRRMNVVSGRNGATVIDDSYNASPGSMEAALEVLRLAPGGALRVAVLGDMLELGDHAQRAHAAIGSLAAESADIVMAIGEHAATVVEAARRAGLAHDRAFVVESADQAVQALDPLLSEKARVLVKGSRGMRLERVVERIREPS